jgi:pentatricopeptide repeat protein
MPSDLRRQLKELRQQVANMHEYYTQLQTMTEELVEAARDTKFRPAFAKWQAMKPTQDLSEATQVEAKAKQALKLLDQTIQKSVEPVPLALQEKMKALQNFLLPEAWIHQALFEYKKIHESSPLTLRERGNQIIEASVKIRDYPGAAYWYETFKQLFPHQSSKLYIDPQVYINIARTGQKGGQLTNQQMFTGLMQSAEEYLKANDYLSAIQSYQRAFPVASTLQQTRDTALKLLQLGNHLYNNRMQGALEALEGTLPHIDLIGLSPDQKGEIYVKLGQLSRNAANIPNALSYYHSAIQANPRNPQIYFELSDLYRSQGDLKTALSQCQQACNLDPQNPNYRQLLFTLETEIGDLFYINGVIQTLRQNVQSLVNYALDAPYGKNIQKALGSWSGTWSAENREIKQLGKTGASAAQVEKDALRLIQLLKQVYDGGKNHMPANQMPYDLKEQIQNLQGQIDEMHALISGRDFSHLMPGGTQEILHQAIEHYLQAYTISPSFGAHCNALIDAYMKAGNFEKAVELYNNLRSQFPTAPVVLSPKAIQFAMEQMVKNKDFVNAIDIVRKASLAFPGDISLRKTLSRAYFLYADHLHKQKDYKKANIVYKNALECGIEPEPACYARFADLYAFALIENKNLENLQRLEINERGIYYSKVLEYRKKAADLDPTNAEYQYICGRNFRFCIPSQPDNAVTYIRRAIALDPKNLDYAYGLIMSLTELHAGRNDEVEEAMEDFKALGGTFSGSDYRWEDEFADIFK